MKITKITLGFVAAAFLFSCAGSQNQKGSVSCEEYNYETAVKDCVSNKQLPKGYFLGEVIPYEAKNKMEENMLSQFASYNTALLRGDFDNACRYQYKDAVKYFRKFYPGESDDNIMRIFFASVSEEMVQTINKYRDNGINLDIVVSRILRKVSQGDDVIYVFEIVSNMVGEKLQLHTTPDKTIAVSANGGKNWTFNAVNEDTPNIMRISYTEDIIDKVMGY